MFRVRIHGGEDLSKDAGERGGHGLAPLGNLVVDDGQVTGRRAMSVLHLPSAHLCARSFMVVRWLRSYTPNI